MKAPVLLLTLALCAWAKTEKTHNFFDELNIVDGDPHKPRRSSPEAWKEEQLLKYRAADGPSCPRDYAPANSAEEDRKFWTEGGLCVQANGLKDTVAMFGDGTYMRAETQCELGTVDGLICSVADDVAYSMTDKSAPVRLEVITGQQCNEGLLWTRKSELNEAELLEGSLCQEVVMTFTPGDVVAFRDGSYITPTHNGECEIRNAGVMCKKIAVEPKKYVKKSTKSKIDMDGMVDLGELLSTRNRRSHEATQEADDERRSLQSDVQEQSIAEAPLEYADELPSTPTTVEVLYRVTLNRPCSDLDFVFYERASGPLRKYISWNVNLEPSRMTLFFTCGQLVVRRNLLQSNTFDLKLQVRTSPFLQYANEVTVLQLLTVKMMANDLMRKVIEEVFNSQKPIVVGVLQVQLLSATTVRPLALPQPANPAQQKNRDFAIAIIVPVVVVGLAIGMLIIIMRAYRNSPGAQMPRWVPVGVATWITGRAPVRVKARRAVEDDILDIDLVDADLDYVEKPKKGAKKPPPPLPPKSRGKPAARPGQKKPPQEDVDFDDLDFDDQPPVRSKKPTVSSRRAPARDDLDDDFDEEAPAPRRAPKPAASRGGARSGSKGGFKEFDNPMFSPDMDRRGRR